MAHSKRLQKLVLCADKARPLDEPRWGVYPALFGVSFFSVWIGISRIRSTLFPTDHLLLWLFAEAAHGKINLTVVQTNSIRLTLDRTRLF